MLPVTNTLQQKKILSVFPIAFVGVAGKATEQRKQHKAVSKKGKGQADKVISHKHAEEAGSKSQAQKQGI